jgi:hypothetical protein
MAAAISGINQMIMRIDPGIIKEGSLRARRMTPMRRIGAPRGPQSATMPRDSRCWCLVFSGLMGGS